MILENFVTKEESIPSATEDPKTSCRIRSTNFSKAKGLSNPVNF